MSQSDESNDKSSKSNGGFVLFSTEVEMYVEALRTFPIDQIGSKKWSSQQEMLEKLNMQAVISANANETEYVKEALLTFDKMPVLVHELIVAELWAERIFGELLKINYEPKNTFVIYLILYHEATLVNLIETVLYHTDVCQSLGDTIYDLVDYCHRKLAEQIRLNMKASHESSNGSQKAIEAAKAKPSGSSEAMSELVEQHKKIQFDIGLKCFSLLRYVVDNLAALPMGVTNRVLNKHDFLLMLVQFVTSEEPIWSRHDPKTGKYFKYVDNKWRAVPAADRFQLSKIEGQVWIALYEMLLNPQCLSKYEYTDFKKNQILKLRSRMNEVLIDQIPNLAALQRFLEQLAVSEPPAYKSSLVIEQVAELYEAVVREWRGKWRKLAEEQASGGGVLDPSDEEVKEKAKRWADAYNAEAVESLIDEPARCAECGANAPKKCSRCQSEWYCRRECQVKHWSKHKKACDMISEAIAAAASGASTTSTK